MQVSNYVPCKRSDGAFGICRAFTAGMLYVVFEDGAGYYAPVDLIF